jgi:hypothetical protein
MSAISISDRPQDGKKRVGKRSSRLSLRYSSRGTWTWGQLAGTDADDAAGADAFDDEIGLEADLDAAAAEGGCRRVT